MNREVRTFICWSKKLALSFMVAFTFQCCGAVTQSKTGLEVSLAVPEGENSSLFWYEVQRKTLRISGDKGEPHELAWENGATMKADVRSGDKLEFSGFDGEGHVLVTGQATVGEEKKVTIPLRRVL